MTHEKKLFMILKYNMESNREGYLIFAESRLYMTKTLIIFLTINFLQEKAMLSQIVMNRHMRPKGQSATFCSD